MGVPKRSRLQHVAQDMIELDVPALDLRRIFPGARMAISAWSARGLSCGPVSAMTVISRARAALAA